MIFESPSKQKFRTNNVSFKQVQRKTRNAHQRVNKNNANIHKATHNEILSASPRPLTVKAVDADIGANGRVSYSMTTKGAAANFFRVNPVTGIATYNSNNIADIL